jgi:DASH complex subunit Dad2
MGGVADVLANWQNIFRAINLATGTVTLRVKLMIVKVSSLAGTEESEERMLPEMLVRIPVTTPDDQKS